MTSLQTVPADLSPAPADRLTHGAPREVRRRLFGMAAVAASIAVVAVVTDLIHGRADAAAAPGPRMLAALAIGISGLVGVAAALERRGRCVPSRRSAFWVLAVGIGVMYLGQAVGYLVTATWPGRFPPWVEDLPMAAGAPVMAVAVVALAWPPGMTRRDWVEAGGDVVTAALGLGVLWILVVLPPQQQGVTALDRTFLATDPWGQFLGLLVVVVIASVSRRSGALALPQLVLMQLTVIVYVVCDIVGDIDPIADQHSVISSSIVGYTLATFVFIAFTVRPALEADSPRAWRMRDWWAIVLPTVPVMLAVLALLASRFVNGPVPAHTLVLVAGALVLGEISIIVMRLYVARDKREARTARTGVQLADATANEWFAALVGDTRDLITVVDRDVRVVYQTAAARRLLGPDPATMGGREFAELLPPEAREAVSRAMLRASHAPDGAADLEFAVMDVHGVRHDTETVVRALRAEGADGFVLTTRDVTDRRLLRAELDASGIRDPLTGLPNREGFLARLRQKVPGGRTDRMALVSLDLLAFRDLNDSRGHAAGDQVLNEVASALDRLPPTVLAVGRTGADEFGLLVAATSVDQEVAGVQRTLLMGLAHVLLADGSTVEVDFALGYAVLGRGVSSVADLVEGADLALATARTTRTPLVRYQPAMREGLIRRLREEADLREALDQDRLVVHYQPILSLADGSLVSMEALVRLRHDDGRLVPPAEFIARAEDLGLIARIGETVLVTALRDVGTVSAALGRDIAVAVNVSAQQVQPTLVPIVAGALAAAGAGAHQLVIELTESMLADHQDQAGATLAGLRALGCRVALDDFGTGYSSLAYLAGLPVDELKIDRSFVSDLGASPTSLALVRAVVQLAQALDLTTVAEGIETVEQADLLRGMGCTWGQGYLYSRPVSLADLMETVTSPWSDVTRRVH